MIVKMDNIQYLNDSYSNCETINLNSNSNNYITFDPYVRVPHNTGPGGYVYTAGTLTIHYFSGSAAGDYQSVSINSTNWTYTNSYAYLDIGPRNISLNRNLFDDTEGGSIYIVYEENNQDLVQSSCENDITFPRFSITPSDYEVNCGNNALKTFTVINENDTPGPFIYYWNVGSGWHRDGSAVSGSFYTSTNSITLEPVSFPPSDVKVEPEVVNGDNFEQLISIVTLSDFNPTIYQITGDNYVCDTGIYTISDLPNYLSVQSASSSDSNIATVSVVNDQITVTKVSDGLVTITAIIENDCGQSVTRTKSNIQIGIPASANNAVLIGDSAVCGTQYYTYTLSGGANHPCINSVNWSVSNQSLEIVSQNSNSVTVKKKLFITQNAGLITASISGTNIEIKKGVWVGLPQNTSLNIQKIGSYDLYAGQWTKLKANYTPLQYIENEPFNYSFDWQIPNSQIRNYTDTAYKDVKPNNPGQLNIGVRVLCDCGYGAFEYRMFNVNSSGGGFQMN